MITQLPRNCVTSARKRQLHLRRCDRHTAVHEPGTSCLPRSAPNVLLQRYLNATATQASEWRCDCGLHAPKAGVLSEACLRGGWCACVDRL